MSNACKPCVRASFYLIFSNIACRVSYDCDESRYCNIRARDPERPDRLTTFRIIRLAELAEGVKRLL